MNQPQRPKISRKPLVLAVSLCLAISAILIPVGAHLPRWIETEMVLAAWWLVWTIALAVILYRGHKVDDDAAWIGGNRTKSLLKKVNDGPSSDLLGGCADPSGCFIDETCFTVVLAILGLILIGVSFFLIVEFVIPAIALLLLASIGGMFARAVNDTHGCEGRVGKSLFWGVAWATVYIGPLAAIVVWVSSLLKH